MVIAKQSTNPEMHGVLHCLNSRDNPVLVVEPPDDAAEDGLFGSVESLVEFRQVIGGGKTPRPESFCYDLVFGGDSDSDSDSDSDTDVEEDAYRWRKMMTYKFQV